MKCYVLRIKLLKSSLKQGSDLLVITSHLLFSQCARVILAPRWTPAAPRRVTATASPTTAACHVTSALRVTILTQAARVSQQTLYISTHNAPGCYPKVEQSNRLCVVRKSHLTSFVAATWCLTKQWMKLMNNWSWWCVAFSLPVFCRGLPLHQLWPGDRTVCVSAYRGRPEVWQLCTRRLRLPQLQRWKTLAHTRVKHGQILLAA